MKRIEDIPDENKGGDCFKTAAETVMHGNGLKLVHAIVSGQGPLTGVKYVHAFALDEKRGVVIDNTQKNPELREIPAGLYWYLGKIETYREYTQDEMYKMLLKHENWGPWDKTFDGVLEESRFDIGKSLRRLK